MLPMLESACGVFRRTRLIMTASMVRWPADHSVRVLGCHGLDNKNSDQAIKNVHTVTPELDVLEDTRRTETCGGRVCHYSRFHDGWAIFRLTSAFAFIIEAPIKAMMIFWREKHKSSEDLCWLIAGSTSGNGERGGISAIPMVLI